MPEDKPNTESDSTQKSHITLTTQPLHQEQQRPLLIHTTFKNKKLTGT